MKLEGIRHQVFEDRYALRDQEGQVLEKTPDAMWRRVARGISRQEKTKKLQNLWEKKYNELLFDFKFLPGGRILLGAGSPYQNVTFYNCFVLPSPQDSRAGILTTLSQMTEVMARGGGVGFNISSLRPRGSHVVRVNGTSSGPVNWAEIFSVMTHDIIQQGGTRRGALMLMMWDWHPDIFEFISVKRDHAKMQGANLSVCISNEFMKRVARDESWDLIFPVTEHPKYKECWHGDIKDWQKQKLPIKIYKTIKARDLWNQICENAWGSAEPGLYFMDRANEMSNTSYFETLVSTNPCGEQPLPPWGVCNLGAINLTQFVTDGEFNFEKLKKYVPIAVHFLDNVIDAENYIFPEMKERQNDERRVGLGTLGLGDALIMMKIRYGSKESLSLIEKIYGEIRDCAYETSCEIAREKGSFEKFNAKQYLKGKFVKNLPLQIRKNIEKNGIRNSVILTQAPTGKTSLLAGVSSGIEPVFSFSYKQKDRLGERTVYHPLFEKWQKEHNQDSALQKKPDYFVTAQDLTPEDHVLVEAAIQKYTDSSISKTVNAPTSHTVDEVKKLYMMAYEKGLKGITYFREGSREGMLTSSEHLAKKVELGGKMVPEVKIRPTKVEGATYRLDTPVGITYITVNHNGGREPMELFLNVGKAGSDISAMAESLGRLISLILRMASPLSTWERAKTIVSELRGIGGSKVVGFGENKVRSLPDAIAKALALHFGFNDENHHAERSEASHRGDPSVASLPQDDAKRQNSKNSNETMEQSNNGSHSLFDICPSCGTASFAYEEGCKKCYSCGYSEC